MKLCALVLKVFMLCSDAQKNSVTEPHTRRDKLFKKLDRKINFVSNKLIHSSTY